MAQVYLGVGSNIDRERHIASCLNHLRQHFGELTISTIYECKAVGFDGPDFFNLAVGLETDLPPEQLVEVLHAIEAEHGRIRTGPRYADRTLDIDLLLYEDQVVDEPGIILPRPEILKHAFVLKPLTEIAPGLSHPTAKHTLANLWAQFPQPADDVVPINQH